MREKLKQLNTARGWLWCAVILSFLINIMFIGKSCMIYLSTDEQAPFAVAAYLKGADWSEITQNLAYYSYGYAFILAPVFWITKSARALYQGAILVNALMASAIVPLAYSVGKRLNRRIPDKLMVVTAFCVAHYSCIIVRAHLALYEMTLIFLVWMMTWLYFSMEERPKLWKYILFGVLLGYSYMVHQRMLAVVLAGLLVLTVSLIRQLAKEKDRTAICGTLLAIVSVGVMFVLHRYLKDLFKTALWMGSSTANTNDFQSLGGRFDKYLTRQGFTSLIKEFFGQMYYMGTATFLFGFLGAFYLIKDNLAGVAALFSGKKPLPEYAMSRLFLLAGFGASVVVSIMFMAGGTERADFLVYGRYIEMMFGPILLIGLVSLISEETRPAVFSLLSVAALIVCTLITDYAYGNVRYIYFADVSSIGISIFHHDGCVHVYEGMLWAVGIFTAAFLILRKAGERIRMAVLGLIACGWTYIGGKLLMDVILPAEQATYEYEILLESRDEGTEDWPVYYSGPSGKTYEAPFIQYLMKDEVLHYIDISELSELPDHCYVINKHSPVEMQDGFSLLNSSNGVFIYRHDGSVRDDVIELPLEMFRTNTGERSEGGITNEKEGVLLYGPYLTLIAGTYEVDIRYEMISDSAEGHFNVHSGDVTHVENWLSENVPDENGIYTAKMNFCLIETWEREEISCVINSGQIRIIDAKMSWTDDMIDLPLSLFATDLAVSDGDGVVNKEPGRLFMGPDITWYKGRYEIEITYEAVTDNLSGSFSMYSGHDQLDETVIDPKGREAVLHVAVGDQPMEFMRLCCDIDSGQIRITNVTIKRDMEE